jgi:hypothetical protein
MDSKKCKRVFDNIIKEEYSTAKYLNNKSEIIGLDFVHSITSILTID